MQQEFKIKKIFLRNRTKYIVPSLSFNDHERHRSVPSSFSLDKYDQVPSPRLIRPHVPLYLLHPELLDTCKVVYVARNPKDVIVSYYHHHRLMRQVHGYLGTLEQFAQNFMDGLGIIYTNIYWLTK